MPYLRILSLSVMTMPRLTAFYFSLALVVGCCQFVRAQSESNTTCIEFYDQAKKSVLGDEGNHQRLLNAFYPLNASSPHLVSVYYCINGPNVSFDTDFRFCVILSDESNATFIPVAGYTYSLADQPLWLTFDTNLLFSLTRLLPLILDYPDTCLYLFIDPPCNETNLDDHLGLLTSLLRSYTTENGAGRDFVRTYYVGVIPDTLVCIYTLSIQLTGVVFHIALTIKAYKFFKKSLKHFFLASLLFTSFVSPLFMNNLGNFLTYFDDSAYSLQWLLILPLIPAFVAPVLFTPCLGYSFVCWRKKGKKQLESFLCNPIAIIISTVTLPFTLLLTSMIFWSIMSVAMYPFEVGLGAIVFVFPCLLYFLVYVLAFQLLITCFKDINSQRAQLIEPRECNRAELVENILLLGSILSLMFAFSMMYYVLIVHNRMINSWNPLQSFFSVMLPTAALTAVMWGMRKLQLATNGKSGNTRRTNVSYGAVRSDEDSHVQLLRNEEP